MNSVVSIYDGAVIPPIYDSRLLMDILVMSQQSITRSRLFRDVMKRHKTGGDTLEPRDIDSDLEVFENCLIALKKSGLISGDERLSITKSGRQYLYNRPEPPGTIVVFDIASGEVADNDPRHAEFKFVISYAYNSANPSVFGDFNIYKKRQLKRFIQSLEDSYKIVGHNVLGFDYKVLENTGVSIKTIERLKLKTFDTYHMISDSYGKRYSLDILAGVNLGKGKLYTTWKDSKSNTQGVKPDMACVSDVEMIKELHDRYMSGRIEFDHTRYKAFIDRYACPYCKCTAVRNIINNPDRDIADMELVRHFMPKSILIKKCKEYAIEPGLVVIDKIDFKDTKEEIEFIETTLRSGINTARETYDEKLRSIIDRKLALESELSRLDSYKRWCLFNVLRNRTISRLKRKIGLQERLRYADGIYGHSRYCTRCRKIITT